MKKLASSDEARQQLEASKNYEVKIVRVEECAADKDMIACRPSGKGTVVFFSRRENEECRIRLIQEGGGWKMGEASFACSESSQPGKTAKVPEPTEPADVAPPGPKPPESKPPEPAEPPPPVVELPDKKT